MADIKELFEQLHEVARKQSRSLQASDIDTETAVQEMETTLKKRRQIMDLIDQKAVQHSRPDDDTRAAICARLEAVQTFDQDIRRRFKELAATVQGKLRSAQGEKHTHTVYHRQIQSEGLFVDRRR